MIVRSAGSTKTYNPYQQPNARKPQPHQHLMPMQLGNTYYQPSITYTPINPPTPIAPTDNTKIQLNMKTETDDLKQYHEEKAQFHIDEVNKLKGNAHYTPIQSSKNYQTPRQRS